MSRVNKGKSIDYLFEDPPIQSQTYAIVSIVGPHMPQKCDVWGLKIRGVTDTLEKAKQLSQRILKIDDNYDIYTVEVGKFFPIAVEAHDVANIEYQNSQLNQLIKSYLENKETANDYWHKRKNEMIQEAIKEGKTQELANKPEHPIAVLQKIKNYEQTIKEMQENLETLHLELSKSKESFSNYTEEERNMASNELQNAIESNKEVIEQKATEQVQSVEDIRKKINEDFNVTELEEKGENNEILEIIEEIKSLEIEINETRQLQETIPNSSKVYERISKNIQDMEFNLCELKNKLTNKELVNQYINKNYDDSKYNF